MCVLLFFFLWGYYQCLSVCLSFSLSLSLSECMRARERKRDAVIQSLVASVPMRPGTGGTAGLKRRFFKIR